MSVFGNRLRALRLRKGLLGKELAIHLNVESAAISNWEKGKRFPKEDKLIEIADYFDCSIDYLLGRTEKESELINKTYPYNLTPEELKNILNSLENVGFDVEKLIKARR